MLETVFFIIRINAFLYLKLRKLKFTKVSSIFSGGLWKTLLENECDVYGAVGCHPKSALYYNNKVHYHLTYMLQHEKMLALGEVGLDYSKTYE